MRGASRDERGVVRVDAAAAAVHVHLEDAACGHHDLHEVVRVWGRGEAVGTEVQHDQFDNPVDITFMSHFPRGFFVRVAYSCIEISMPTISEERPLALTEEIGRTRRCLQPDVGQPAERAKPTAYRFSSVG